MPKDQELHDAYVKKHKAWEEQQRLSIEDSKNRIDYLQRQNDINNSIIESCTAQIKHDTEILKRANDNFEEYMKSQ